MRILLVEDNEQLSALMAERLAVRGIDVDSASSVEQETASEQALLNYLALRISSAAIATGATN